MILQSKQSDENKSLSSVLEKCTKEAEVNEEEQPIYICVEEETIKCRWCTGFKGSREARVINQHIKSAKTHLTNRQRQLNPDALVDPLQGVRDIRTYFDV